MERAAARAVRMQPGRKVPSSGVCRWHPCHRSRRPRPRSTARQWVDPRRRGRGCSDRSAGRPGFARDQLHLDRDEHSAPASAGRRLQVRSLSGPSGGRVPMRRIWSSLTVRWPPEKLASKASAVACSTSASHRRCRPGRSSCGQTGQGVVDQACLLSAPSASPAGGCRAGFPSRNIGNCRSRTRAGCVRRPKWQILAAMRQFSRCQVQGSPGRPRAGNSSWVSNPVTSGRTDALAAVVETTAPTCTGWWTGVAPEMRGRVRKPAA